MMNTSLPRMLSAKRGRISPLANSVTLASPRTRPRCSATSPARAGWVRPEYSANRLVVSFSIGILSRSVRLGSVEGARHGTRSHRTARRQVDERADPGAVADLAVPADGVLHRAPCAHGAVDEAGVRPDLAAIPDGRGALQDAAGID